MAFQTDSESPALKRNLLTATGRKEVSRGLVRFVSSVLACSSAVNYTAGYKCVFAPVQAVKRADLILIKQLLRSRLENKLDPAILCLSQASLGGPSSIRDHLHR